MTKASQPSLSGAKPASDRPAEGGAATAGATPLKPANTPSGDAAEKPAGPRPKAKKAARPPAKGPAGRANPPPVVQVRPLAEPATMRRRHWGLMFSFVLLVLIPLASLAFYLWNVAEDQYGSTTGFTVRQEESGSASELLGGLVQFGGGGGVGADGDILYEFIQSQEMVQAIDAKLDLRLHYSRPWPDDILFALDPEATMEDLVRYWQRIVRISYDQSSGLTELRVLAFDPDMAQRVAEEIVVESQAMINALNTQAREDAMRYARVDLEDSLIRLKAAREALTQFRTRTQIVDPAADIQGRMGVMNTLQQQLAEALINYDLLLDSVNPGDPRLTSAERLIEVIRGRIAVERENFASDSTETGGAGEDYPSLIAEFESLSVDREFAEGTYRAALAALDVARANAARQSRYLASYIQPTLAQTSEFPRRFVLLGLAALFLMMAWSIGALIYYSIRDRS